MDDCNIIPLFRQLIKRGYDKFTFGGFQSFGDVIVVGIGVWPLKVDSDGFPLHFDLVRKYLQAPGLTPLYILGSMFLKETAFEKLDSLRVKKIVDVISKEIFYG